MPTLVIVRRPRTARSVTQTVRMRFLVGTGLLSRIFAGDPASTLVAPLVLLSLASVSYPLRPSNRRLSAVPNFADRAARHFIPR